MEIMTTADSSESEQYAPSDTTIHDASEETGPGG